MRSRWNCLVVGSCNVFGLALLVLSATGGGSAVRAEDPATLPSSVLEKIAAGIEQRVADLQASVAAFADSFTARRIAAQELCVGDAGGAQTCITKAQLDALIRGTVQTGQAPAAIAPDQTQQTAAADKSDAPVALVVPPPETMPVTEPSGAPLAVPPAQVGESRGGEAATPEVAAVPEAALREVEAAPEAAAAREVEAVPETTAAIPSATQPTIIQPAAASREAGAPLAEVPSQPSEPADRVMAASAKSQSIAEERTVTDEDPVQRGSTETTSAPPEAAPAEAAPVPQRVE